MFPAMTSLFTVFFILLLGASLEGACPRLEGHYYCTDQMSDDLIVIKEDFSHIPFYSFSGNSSYILRLQNVEAEGALHQLPPEKGLKKLAYRAYCQGKKLHIQEVVGDTIFLERSFSTRRGGDLNMEFFVMDSSKSLSSSLGKKLSNIEEFLTMLEGVEVETRLGKIKRQWRWDKLFSRKSKAVCKFLY